MENTIDLSVNKDPNIIDYKEKLRALRKDGVFKLHDARENKNDVRKNKLLSNDEKMVKLQKYEQDIIDAKENIASHKEEIASLVKESVAYTKKTNRPVEKETFHKALEDRKNIRYDHTIERQKLTEEYSVKETSIKKKYSELVDKEMKEYSKLSIEEKKKVQEKVLEIKKDRKIELSELKMSKKASFHDEKTGFLRSMQASKDEVNDIYLLRRNTVKELRNGHETILEGLEGWGRNKLYTFDLKKFLLNNALYITIFLIYIVCIIVAPVTGRGQLLTMPSILQILEQSSTRMFYALGVAGLILLAGTDLSVGRMIALGSVTTAVFLHDGQNVITFFGLPGMDFTAIPMFLRVVIALVCSIIFCTAFSALAGFFTAKFKMHPFITTLSTQLLIYGLLYFATTGTPTGGVESGIKEAIGGQWSIGEDFQFPKLIVYAIIAIVVVWFIWNKTKFGKNMYAVGGNREAAAVSGISVFWTTLGVFIMAGILYGFGSFFESFRSNSSAGTGQGMELDAIAACVVGGISFSGGIGKIRGAVLGVIIFTGLTYCLSFLNIDTNLQFVFKGIIIMAACALDSVKYLKKK